MIPATGIPSFPPVFGIWMSDGNQLPPAGETACPTYFAKRLIQQGGAGGFACRSHGHNQWSASKLNKFPKTVKHPTRLACRAGGTEARYNESQSYGPGSGTRLGPMRSSRLSAPGIREVYCNQ